MAFRSALPLCVTLFIGSAALLACATPEAPAPVETTTYTGQAAGSDAVFAVSMTDTDVALYVCGGADTFAVHSRWYRGARSEGQTEIELEATDGSLGKATLSIPAAGAITGSVTEESGTSLELSGAETVEGSVAGLYSAVDSGCRTGVVVWEDASGETRVQGTWCNDEGIFEQVTPIAPVESSSRGLTVQTVQTGNIAPRHLRVLAIDPADL